MAVAPQPPPRPSQAQSQPAPARQPAPPEHPAPPPVVNNPPPATPGVPEPDHDPANQPKEEKKPEDKPVPKEEASLYFRGGHRLRKKGDPPEKWFIATRLAGQLCIARPVDEETEKEALEGELVLAD